MRINKYLAAHTTLSRRSADSAIANGRVAINGVCAENGYDVQPTDSVMLDGMPIAAKEKQTHTIMLNKPVGYVCSRNGQGSDTIYALLPAQLSSLNIVGRLDKDSSGLLLLTNDGELANNLTHPRYEKQKMYEITLDRYLSEDDRELIVERGVNIGDERLSTFDIRTLETPQHLLITLMEGRNRQIRRTFEARRYRVMRLHRIKFGTYDLGILSSGKYIEL